MGLNEASNILFLNVSCGKLVNKKQNMSGFSYTGKITSIVRKEDEYEGKPLMKIKVFLSDGKDKACVSFTEESWYSQGFFSRIEKADLNKSITLGVGSSEKNEKISFCWMKQDGETIKRNLEYPVPDKVTMGRQIVSDWSKFLSAEEKTLAEIQGRLLDGGHTSDADLPFGDDVPPPVHSPAPAPSQNQAFGRRGK